MKETKEERFIRIASTRVDKIISSFRALGRCSATNIYAYSDKQIAQILVTLQDEIERLKDIFLNPTLNGRERFSLSAKPVKPGLERCPSVTLDLPQWGNVGCRSDC